VKEKERMNEPRAGTVTVEGVVVLLRTHGSSVEICVGELWNPMVSVSELSNSGL
jgi:hypothetical protein